MENIEKTLMKLKEIDKEIELNPSCLKPLTKEMWDDMMELTKGVVVDINKSLDDQ